MFSGCIETAMAHMSSLALKQVYYEEELYSTNLDFYFLSTVYSRKQLQKTTASGLFEDLETHTGPLWYEFFYTNPPVLG